MNTHMQTHAHNEFGRRLAEIRAEGRRRRSEARARRRAASVDRARDLLACLDERVVGPRGRPRVQTTRAVFLIAPRPADARLAIECHVTVRGRDLVTVRDVQTLTVAGLERLEYAAEGALLALAEGWANPDAGRSRRPLDAAA